MHGSKLNGSGLTKKKKKKIIPTTIMEDWKRFKGIESSFLLIVSSLSVRPPPPFSQLFHYLPTTVEFLSRHFLHYHPIAQGGQTIPLAIWDDLAIFKGQLGVAKPPSTPWDNNEKSDKIGIRRKREGGGGA